MNSSWQVGLFREQHRDSNEISDVRGDCGFQPSQAVAQACHANHRRNRENLFYASISSVARRSRNARAASGYAVVCFKDSIAKREVTFFSGTAAIRRL